MTNNGNASVKFTPDQLLQLIEGKKCLVKCGEIFFEVSKEEVISVCNDWKTDQDAEVFFDVTVQEDSEFFWIMNVEQIKKHS